MPPTLKKVPPPVPGAEAQNLSTDSIALVRRELTSVIIALRCTLLNSGEVIMLTSHLLLRN